MAGPPVLRAPHTVLLHGLERKQVKTLLGLNFQLWRVGCGNVGTGPVYPPHPTAGKSRSLDAGAWALPLGTYTCTHLYTCTHACTLLGWEILLLGTAQPQQAQRAAQTEGIKFNSLGMIAP